MDKKKIAIFASGSGSNAENIARYFKDHSTIEIVAILSNNPKAYVLERALKMKIPTHVFDRESFFKSNSLLHFLEVNRVDVIVLAGFLWLVPSYLIEHYPDRIINIHPALLPDFGGKGMYGNKVHTAVIQSGVAMSGITIHLVNNEYDKGKILFQATCKVFPHDTPDTLAEKIHALEYAHFPQQIEAYILSK